MEKSLHLLKSIIKIIVLKFDNFLARIVDRLRDRLKRRKEEEQENNDFNSPS